MAVSKIFLCLGIIINLVSGIKICGLENYKSCDPFNNTCILKQQYPKYMNWFKNGRPEYFIKPISSLSYKELEVPVDDGIYYLEDVIVTGAEDTKLLNYRFDRHYKKGSFNMTLAINVEVTAKCLYKKDSDGNRITRKKPFCAKLGHINADANIPLYFVFRCDGTEFVDFKNEDTIVYSSPKNYVIIRKGKPSCEDKKMFEFGIINTVGELVAQTVVSSFRILSTTTDVNILLDFTAYDIKEPHKCEFSRAKVNKK